MSDHPIEINPHDPLPDPSLSMPESQRTEPLERKDLTTNTDSRKVYPKGFPIVGIGASAGGLEAIEAFFDQVPLKSGMAYVLVQHLSPDFKSMMDELLARHTKIAIHRVTDEMQVEPDAIYLIPPRKQMLITDGKLLLSDKNPEQGLTLPIDIFFRSLARDAGPSAIGVILSGTGSDGSRGIRDIHDAGGFVVAQDLETAKFDGMPKSAIETGIVDLVLPPGQIPPALLTYIQHPEADERASNIPTDPALLEGFDAIFQLLRKSYDIDFSYYKRTTVTRRVHRRLLMNQVTNLEAYVERLRNDANELNLLYKDLLIGVTKFFRDGEAFRRLEQDVLPELIERVRPEEEVRIWVAGCATGEEAYSIAILVYEQLERLNRPINAKIFATDVHQSSLSYASLGIYGEASLSEVSAPRLERFFTRHGAGYQVSSLLRQMIVFAPHNIVKDAPFTKIELVTCRNLLIYLEPQAQRKAISLFHFALNTGGVMFMGPSESPGELADEFAPIDERWKIFRKLRDKRLPHDLRLPLSSGYATSAKSRGLDLSSSFPAPPNASLVRAYDELLKDFAPPSLLINDRRELVQSFSGAAEYLSLRDGRPSPDVLELVVPDLKIPLSTALQQAAKKKSSIALQGVRVHTERGERNERIVRLTVKPMPDRQGESGHFLVMIEPQVRPTETSGPVAETMNFNEASRDQLNALELELRYSRENLQATIEEMETSNEELQATNEELVASNEELQSTNEELHSVNEELYTVNAEYQKKIAELTEMTSDMDNLLHNTDVGVIFLDRNLCIRKFTPKIVETFHLLPLDIGRRIDSFAHNISRADRNRVDLLSDARRVLSEEAPIETEVHDGNGKSLLLRILPYRSRAKVEGVLLTLIDISQLKRAEKKLQLMSKVFHDGADPIVIEDLNGKIVDLNSEAERFHGWAREELLGRKVDVLIPVEQRAAAQELRDRCREKGGLRNIETTSRNKSAAEIPVLLTLSLLTDESGQPIAIATIAKDITDRKRAERINREAVQKRDQFLAMLSHELRNPLNAVLNASYLLDPRFSPSLSKEVNFACNIIQRQALQVARLLDDLLDVARVTQGKIEIRRQIIDLTQLVDDAVQAVQPLIDSRNHQLQIDVPNGPVFIEGDPARLLQIQENLLTNAAKYTPLNGKIWLSLLQEQGEAVIRVRDSGRGIPPHMLESIFELFVQSENTLDRSDGGMGLGLTLVQILVHMHGGRVTAHSEGVNRGSEFVVRLPLTAARPSHANIAVHSTVPVDSRHQRILIVEDNDDSRDMLEALLKMDGYSVTVAKDGKQGLDAILRQRPDIAIVDIGLPEISGYEIAKETRRQVKDADVFLIALTGYGRTEDCEAVRRAGFNLHLVKPLKPGEISRVLAERASERTNRGNVN